MKQIKLFSFIFLGVAVIFSAGISHAFATSSLTGCGDNTTLTQSEAQLAVQTGAVTIATSIDSAHSNAVAVITNNTACALPVSFISYQMFDKVLTNQKYFAGGSLVTIAGGTTQTISVSIPNCMSQSDVYYGVGPQVLTGNSGPLNLAYVFSQNNGTGLSDASGNFCQLPPPPPSDCANGTTLTYAEALAAKASHKVQILTLGWSADGHHGESIVANHTSCALPMSLISYQMYDNVTPLTQTMLDNSGVITIAASSTGTLSVNIAACLTQVDLYYGAGVTDFLHGTNGNVMGGIILGTDGRTFTSITATQGTFCQAPVTTSSLVATCSANPSTVNIGDSVAWSATASGGSGTGFTFSWTGDDGLIAMGSSTTKTYASAGTKNATILVTDSNNATTTSTCAVTVNAPAGGGGGGGGGGGSTTIATPPSTTGSSVATPAPVHVTVTSSVASNQVAGVYLTQVPYTGLKENALGALVAITIIASLGFVGFYYNKKRGQYAYEMSAYTATETVLKNEAEKILSFSVTVEEYARTQSASVSADALQAIIRASDGNIDWAKSMIRQVVAYHNSHEWTLVTLDSIRKIYPYI